jgi:ornithine cyclodeaminase
MLQLDARAVAARLGRAALIDALDRAFRADVVTPARRQHLVGDDATSRNVLLVMPAWQPGGRIGVKLVTVFPDNASFGQPSVHAAYVLFDGTTGMPLAVLDGTELTRRRTAAASALAARYLASPHACRLLVIGTGEMAPHLIDSHATVCPIRSVRVWGRRPDRARALAASFDESSFHVEAADDLEIAVRWADIISCATLAETPLVEGAWLRPGQHLDLVGAFSATMREVDDAALARARIFVDTREGALAESGELIHALASGAIRMDDIHGELADLARGLVPGRQSPDEITLFKSVGTALEDLAAAELALHREPVPD